MPFDIPSDLNLEDFGSGNSEPAPSGQPVDAPSQSAFDPNLVINYKASGKDIAEPLATVITRAQRGYDYSRLVEQHKSEVAARQAEFDRRAQELSQLEQTWKPYHEYASQNPEWADFVRTQWENRFTSQQAPAADFGQNQGASTFNLPPEISRELSEMRQFVAEVKTEKELARQAHQDAALHQEIDEVRKAYPDIDFSHTNPETGESLEGQLLRHMQERRIYNVSAAFKDMYFDKLLERNVLKAKEDVAKAMQVQNKQGFLASSNQPMLTRDQNQASLKGMSYHQAMDYAAKEFGL